MRITFRRRIQARVVWTILAAIFAASIGHSTEFDQGLATATYRLLVGDFNGDQRADLLWQGAPNVGHRAALTGVALAEEQRWRDGYLGVVWNRQDTNLVVGDFNGDASSDVLLQALRPGSLTQLILAETDGKLAELDQQIGDYHLGFRWDGGHHRLLVGDFDGNSQDDIFLQGQTNKDRHALALSSPRGQFEAIAFDFDNAHLGADWQAKNTNVSVGDFDGDGRSELILQTKGNGPVTRVASMNGLLDTVIETIESDRMGLDWSAKAHRLIAGDFTGDGLDDLFLLATNGAITSALVTTVNDLFEQIHREIKVIPDLDKVEQILVGDFDADGIDDLILTFNDPALSPLVLLANEPRRAALDAALRQLGLLNPGQILRAEAGTVPHIENREGSQVLPTTRSAGTGRFVQPASSDKLAVTSLNMAVSEASSAAGETPIAANAVGRLQGEAAASGGTASYTIPVAVPLGRHGVQPSVSLSYSSRAGNGIAGMGWSLNAGQSSIHRCASNVRPFGIIRSVAMNNDDKLCLDGRLLVTAGAYGVDGATYRTEVESYDRVTQLGVLSSAGSSFVVTHKDGSRSYFDQAAVPTNATAPLSWLLTRHIDLHGNTISYTYAKAGDGEWLLTQINYTGFSPAPSYTTQQVGSRSVVFEYVDRSDRSSSWLAGGVTSQTRILKRIKTFAPDQSGVQQLVRDYTLHHELSQATQRSLLTWVQECAQESGATVCLKETQFSWDDKKPSFVLEKLGVDVNAAGLYQDKRRIEDVLPRGDTNGDGVLDWPATDVDGDGVIEAPGYYINAEGTLNGYNTTPIRNCIPNYHSRSLHCISADFDNNGLTDQWKKQDSTLRIALQLDGGITSSWYDTQIVLNKPTSRPADELQAVTDLNSDGWKDLVVYHDTSSGAQLKVYYHSQNTAAPYTPSNSQVMYAWNFTLVSNGTSQVSTVQAHLADDFDGNGLPDVVVTQVTKIVDGVPVGIPAGLPKTIVFSRVAADRSVSFTPASLESLVPSGEEPYLGVYVLNPQNRPDAFYFNYFHDVNGDGLVDWLGMGQGSLKVRINTGGRFLSWQSLGEIPAGLQRVQSQEYLWNAQDGELGYISWLAYDQYLRVMDINNDGKPELLVPNARRASACYKVLWGGSGYRYHCDDELYGTYKPSSSSSDTAITFPDRDSGLFEYDAVYFEQNASGGYTSRTEASGLIGTAVHTAAADIYGKGLTDFVTTIGCRNPTLCAMAGDAAVSGIPGLTTIAGAGIPNLSEAGVYVNRNRGSASGVERYRPIDSLRAVTDGFGLQSEWVLKPLSTKDHGGETCSSSMARLYETDHGYLSGAPAGEYFHFASSMYVVAELRQSNGVGGTNITKYRYRGAVYNGWGRGFQGFREIISEDSKGLRSCDTFAQIFPLTGLPTQQKVKAVAGDRLLSDTTNTLDYIRPFGDNLTYLPYIRISSGNTKDLSGVQIGTNVTTVELDAWGNPKKTTTVVSDAYVSQESVTETPFVLDLPTWPDKSYTSKTTKKLTAIAAPVPAGVDNVPVTHATSITEWFDINRRLPKTIRTGHETDAGQQIITGFSYDSYGNTLTTSVSGGAGISAVSQRSSSVVYEAEGYFPDYLLNALNHQTDVTIDPRNGQLVFSRDPLNNALTTAYDGFGRAVRKQINSRTAETTRYDGSVSGDGVALAKYKVKVDQPGIKPAVTTWFDALNRPLRTDTDDPLDGTRKIRGEVVYDAYGRTLRQSTPYFNTTTPSGCQWNEFVNYDVLNRPERKKLPNDNGCQLTITYTYNGPETTVQVGPDSGYQISRVKNVLGQWWQVTDQGSEASYGNEASLTTHFRYDAQGNPVLIQRTPSTGAAIRNTASYNVLGQKMAMTDPDRGTWSFDYNVLGELVHQEDARHQHTWFDYDGLGRALARYEATGAGAAKPGSATASWNFSGACYNGTASNGRLLCGSGKTGEVSKAYSYNGFGQLTGTVYNLTAPGESAKSFTVNQDYDPVEQRPLTLTYPAATGGTALALQTVYHPSSGVAYQARSLNALAGLAAAATLQQLNALDAFGNVRSEWLGNGLNTERTFSEHTGRLTGVCVNPVAGCYLSSAGNLQAIDYGAGGTLSTYYDAYGNLIKQANPLQGVTETFAYDRRMRLVQSARVADVGAGFPALSQTVDYRYDQLGNLLSKSDFAASYRYDTSTGVAPHQVKDVRDALGAVIAAYSFDATGNLTDEIRANDLYRHSDYNHQQVPSRITRGGASSDFYYDENNERYFEKHIASGTTTKVWKLGKLYEYSETTDAAGTSKEEKSYFGSHGQYSYKPAQNGKAACGNWRFFHTDRLGSVETITTVNKQVLERHGFDPFGKPRAGNWMVDNTLDGTTATQKGLYNRVTTRGYTGHDHIDSVGLIHMNGRAYDPELGRMLGVDPFMQSPLNSQSMNPYAYVMNNPLAGTDPTGYCSESEGGDKGDCGGGTEGGKGERKGKMTGSRIDGVNTGATCSGTCGASYGGWTPPSSGKNNVLSVKISDVTDPTQLETIKNDVKSGKAKVANIEGNKDHVVVLRVTGGTGNQDSDPFTPEARKLFEADMLNPQNRIVGISYELPTIQQLNACLARGGCVDPADIEAMNALYAAHGQPPIYSGELAHVDIPIVTSAATAGAYTTGMITRSITKSMANARGEDANSPFSNEKGALVDMAKADKKAGGITRADMDAYKDLNRGLPDPFPSHKIRGPEVHPNNNYPHARQPHGHVGPVDHIPIVDF